MREEDSNWFSKWEDDLPPPDELMPISQTLITPDLAIAFDIRNPNHNHHNHHPVSLLHHPSPPHLRHHNQHQQPVSTTPPTQPNSSELDSSSAELGGTGGAGAGGGGGGGEEPARTLKRPRLVWTPQLHKRFVDAVAHLGIKNAVPKTIMQLMSVDGLTRENVASHLQKYRLYLKRMQGMGNGGGPGTGSGGPGSGLVAGSGDSATDHLFASSPVPAHFLHQSGAGAGTGGPGNGGSGGRPSSDHFMQYMSPVAALHHQHQIQAQFRQMGHYGSPTSGGGSGGGVGHFEQHPLLTRQAQLQAQLGATRNGMVQNNGGYVEDVESVTAANNGRKVLTLFPTGDD